MDCINTNAEQKINTDNLATLCRCCLKVVECSNYGTLYESLFYDLTGLNMSQLVGLPAWICAECTYLLIKCVKFKHKIVKAHNILYEYSTRCAPFPVDAQDTELKQYATPQLCATEVLLVDNNGKMQGFHPAEEHKKVFTYTDLTTGLDLNEVKIENVPQVVKAEGNCSDLDDNIPLEEFRSKCEEDFDVTDCDIMDNDFDIVAAVSERKMKKMSSVKKKKSSKSSQSSRKSSVRKQLDIDPKKITTLILNHEEQLKFRDQQSKDPKYLKSPFKCKMCYKGFNHENKLDNHMSKHSPNRGKFECKLCHVYLPTIYSYNIHELTHTTRYVCNECGRKMVDRYSIVEHYSTTHEGVVKEYPCLVCGKISHNLKTHYGHMRNHHSGDRPKCDQCGKSFINRDSLNDHMLIHQGIKNHECEICLKRFRTNTQLKHHQLKHSDSRNYYCVECDVRFKSEFNMRRHLLDSVKHRDKSQLKYECPRCDARLVSAGALSHHLTFQHDGLRLFSCTVCGASLATRNSLTKHMRYAHQGHKPPLKHICDTCGKAFRSKNVLVNHVRTHTGEKPFECPECGRKFSQRTAMKTHVKLVHLKIKRNEKVKEIQPIQPTIVAKEELTLTFDEDWQRRALQQGDIYFTVTSE